MLKNKKRFYFKNCFFIEHKYLSLRSYMKRPKKENLKNKNCNKYTIFKSQFSVFTIFYEIIKKVCKIM